MLLELASLQNHEPNQPLLYVLLSIRYYIRKTQNQVYHAHKGPRMSLGFLISLLLPLGCWDYKPAPPQLVYGVPGIEHRAPCTLGKHSSCRVAQAQTP